MKKLKTWQIVLMIIFYPVGIGYLIWRACKKNKSSVPAQMNYQTNNNSTPAQRFDISKAEIIRDFHTKVVGVSFNNADGSSRQQAIRECMSGEDIFFRPLPTPEYPDTIGVFSKYGKQIGVLKAGLDQELKYKYPMNPMSCTISDIHGGDDGKYLGVNLHIVIYKQP